MAVKITGKGQVRIQRREPHSMDQLVRAWVKSMQLTPALNSQRIFAAWDAVSGAGPFTLRRFFRDGTLYITVDSSVVRNQLWFQRADLVVRINAFLAKDELYTPDARTAEGPVRQLILK